MNIIFFVLFYQYFMNKPVYYFYLTEFWLKLGQCVPMAPKTLTEN